MVRTMFGAARNLSSAIACLPREVVSITVSASEIPRLCDRAAGACANVARTRASQLELLE
jgi:hypothetical protein